VVTTNEERELPQAFLRRCVVLWLEQPLGPALVEIGRRHLEQRGGGVTAAELALAGELVQVIGDLRAEARQSAVRPPSTAEFLDALFACRELGITVDSDRWAELRGMLLVKQQQPG
jgi:MoxR-like ATPase